MIIDLWHDKHEVTHRIDWLPNVGDIIYLSEECEFSELSKTYTFRVYERQFWDDNYKKGIIEVSIMVKRAYNKVNSVKPKKVNPKKQKQEYNFTDIA